jgi:hypothetical protein
MGIAELLETAHKIVARATGKIALAISTKKFSPTLARELAFSLRVVADALDEAADGLDQIKKSS